MVQLLLLLLKLLLLLLLLLMLMLMLLLLLLLLLLFGPVEHALGAGRLEVEPAQCAGRASDEIVTG